MFTDSEIEEPNATGRREKRADGQGLYLLVTPTGRRSWSMTYRLDGKVRTLLIGRYPGMSLAEARYRCEEVRRALDRGEDPGVGSQRQKREKAKVDRARRFDAVAETWFKSQVEPRRDARYAARVWSRVETDLLPALGEKDVGEITPSDVLAALQAVERRTTKQSPEGAIYSAKRIGGYARAIFDHARFTHNLTGNPAERISRALRPNPPEVGQPSLPPADVWCFYSAMARPHDDEELTRLALELVMHTTLRSGELRGGRWAEIRGDEWHVPAERMKVKRPHVVPLSRQARHGSSGGARSCRRGQITLTGERDVAELL